MTKYRKLIALYVIPLVIALFSFLYGWVFLGSGSRGVTPLIPVNNSILEIFLMYIIIYPLSAIAGSFIGGYVLVPLFLFFHKRIIGRNLIYGIQEKVNPNKVKTTFRTFFPILMAMNFAFFLKMNENLVQSVLYPDYYSQIVSIPVSVYWSAILVFLIFTLGFSFALFSPSWFLLDAGITYTNKKKVKDTDFPIEVHSVGGFFMNFLKGYAGIGVIFSYYQFVSEIFPYYQGISGIRLFFGLSYYLALLPILLTMLTITIILLEVTKKRRLKYVRKVARKYGIIDTINVSFEIVMNEEFVDS